MDDDGRQPIAMGHLSDSGDLKILSDIIQCYRTDIFKNVEDTNSKFTLKEELHELARKQITSESSAKVI